ncbi:ABC transporter substrate-binding protein [Pararhodobacter zhoushanensis]|uniref:ABC transporter substrate-binding protein n=1 Tax=Pararhodobacter zhoushanensis TaxID=2479545 RepID=A0ABT3H5S4_9RHOB|nr:ABC transporter substrate-binding protein [Pararhodobacter zhoushanensis]MCW1935070.1 ABC transporter substrate-binding protein [Pararhodobacter zhoushanensis]
MKRRTLMLASAAVALMALPLQAQERTHVTLLYTATTGFMTAWVAADQGFFANHGVDVDLQMAQNGSVIVAGVVSGSAEVGLPTPTVAFQAIENGLDLRAFASTNIFPETANAGVVVGADSGIETAADLVGKTVGVPGVGGLLDVTMRQWLSTNGVDLSQVNIVEIGLPQTGDAIRAGQVDAVASVDPFSSRAVDSGVGRLIGNYFDVIPDGSAAGIFVTTADWAAENAEAIEGMQRALIEAADFIREHEAEARESIARYTTLPPPVVANVPLPNLGGALDPQVSLGFWNDLAVRQGLIYEPIDLETFVIPFPAE